MIFWKGILKRDVYIHHLPFYQPLRKCTSNLDNNQAVFLPFKKESKLKSFAGDGGGGAGGWKKRYRRQRRLGLYLGAHTGHCGESPGGMEMGGCLTR